MCLGAPFGDGQVGMDERADGMLRELALRVAALEDNVAFLEVWCEEHEDALERMGESAYWRDEEPEPVQLRIVDLTDDAGMPEETDHQRKVRQLRDRLMRLRSGLVAVGDEIHGGADAVAASDWRPSARPTGRRAP